MAFLNPEGRIAHGRLGAGAFLDNDQFDTGDYPCWLTTQQIVYRHIGGDGTYLAKYDVMTLTATPIAGPDATNLEDIKASGVGHWAAWAPDTGLWSSMGFTLPAASGTLIDMSPDGAIAYRDAAGIVHVREVSGEITTLSPNPAIEVRLLGDGQAIWVEGGVLKCKNLPSITMMAGAVLTPEAVLIGTEWWIAYHTDATGSIIHPFTTTEGYTLGSPLIRDLRPIVPTTTLRYVWGTTLEEEAGTVFSADIDTLSAPRVATLPPGTSTVTIAGVAVATKTALDGTRVLTSSSSFSVAFASAEELATIELDIVPSFPTASGYGRLIHPVLGAFDYEVKPDEWVNIDADAIIPPMWSSTRTLTSAANVLWQGNIRDVVVEERWKALGGLAMPITQLRMLLAIWTNPIDPDVGYVYWYPNYITQVAFKVLPVNLTAGGQGVTFDDVVNYKDEHGDPIGWVTAPVTLQMKLVERL